MGPTATSLAPLVAPVSAPLLPPENRREDKRRRTRQSSPSIAASTVLVADTVSSDGTESPAELFRMSNRSFSLADSASNTAAANTTPLRRSAEPTLLNRSHFPLSSTPRSAPSTPPTPGEASFSGQSSSDEIRGRVSEIIDSLPCLTLSPSTKSPVSKPVHVDGPLKGKFGPGVCRLPLQLTAGRGYMDSGGRVTLQLNALSTHSTGSKISQVVRWS